MGQCHGKNIAVTGEDEDQMPPKPSSVPTSRRATPRHQKNSAPATPTQYQHQSSNATWPSPYPTSGATGSPLPAGVSPSPARSTPRRFFKRPFPPPSPAKHIKASIVKRFGPQRPKEGPIPEEGTGELERPLDKNFGFSKNFVAKYELGKEVGRGHFGHTCSATVKKGEFKGQTVAVKIISKAKVR
jgi:hypothetical protein